ncbi:MAG: hypothetical protein U1F43_36925 [Myxococcota bacterium]
MSSAGARATPSATPIVVDATATHQAMFGFGATTISLAFGDTDNVPAALRAEAIAALYRDVHLTTGNLGVEPSEADPSNVYAPKNDNAGSSRHRPERLQLGQSRNMHDLVVAPARRLRLRRLVPRRSSRRPTRWPG